MWCCDKCEILFNLEQLYKINFDYLLVDHPDDKKITVVLFKIKHTQAKINLQTQILFKNQQFFNPYKNETSKFKLMQKHHFTKQDQTITIHVIIN